MERTLNQKKCKKNYLKSKLILVMALSLFISICFFSCDKKVFREMKWAEELGSGKKNIKKFAPLYYDKYKIEIQNNEKFVFSITYRDVDEDFKENEEGLSDQATKRPSRCQAKANS